MASHLVLVPGFGGFDALGSIRYYHGVTEVLQMVLAFDSQVAFRVRGNSSRWVHGGRTASKKTTWSNERISLKTKEDIRRTRPSNAGKAD